MSRDIRPALVALALLVTGCGAAPWEAAQTTTSTIAHVVKAADDIAAEEYTERARVALDAAESLEEYRERMRPLDIVERALRSAHRFLSAAQAGVLAWRAGDAGDSWRAAMPCLAMAVADLLSALTVAGVPIPPEMQQGADILAGFLGSRCVEVAP